MKLRISSVSSLLVVGVMGLSMVAGCGRHAGTLVDPAVTPSPSASSPAATGSITPTPQPSYNPTPVPTTLVDLQKGQTNVTTSGLMMFRQVTATVDVMNPNDIPVSGQVTCTFGDGSSSGQVQTKSITLNPRSAQTLVFTEKSWFDKTANVQVTTIQTPTMQPTTSMSFSNSYY